MVVAGILALALALPTGALFGIGYGTGVRIGYEQIYPLLFPAGKDGKRNTTSTVSNIKQINQIYDAIGGKEASQMGIATGLASAMSELDSNPDFRDLLALESSLSGSTPENSAIRTRYGLDNISQSAELSSNRDTPSTILDIPIFTEGAPYFVGPQKITNKFGYASMSKQQLLNNQPSQMKPKPSNLDERLVHWKHFYKLIIDFPTVKSRQTDAYTLATGRSIYDPSISSNPSNKINTSLPSQFRKRQIAESGQSPLATAAVNKFKSNIENAVTNLEKAIQTKNQTYIRNATKKLGALRIKFKETYGYYY